MNLRIKAIQTKIQELIAKDTAKSVFGADSHQYELHPCLSKEEVSIWEAANQIQLPQDYKDFITQVANGGVGPYYGLYSLEIGIEEAQEYAVYEEKTIEKSFCMDFPVSAESTQNFITYYYDCLDEGDDDEVEYFDVPDLLTGVIFLADYGCGWSYVLVVKGEMTGTVWLTGDYFTPCFEGTRENIRIWSFLDWYENWLDNTLKSFEPKPEKEQVGDNIDPNTTIINYDGWRLGEIPEKVFACKNLKKLVFSRNEIKEFPMEMMQLQELRILDLSMNPLTDIPEEIAQLSKLKKLHLNYNYHTQLPQSLEKMQLEEVNMYYNYKLPEIPPVLFKIPTLKILYFSHCSELNNVAEEIANLKNLEKLYLTGCGALEHLPESIGSLENLKYLYLDNTGLKKLPESFSNLKDLRGLYLGAHLDLDDTFEKLKHLPKLEYLKIGLQKDFPPNFAKLQALKTLIIDSNYALPRDECGHYLFFPLSENISLIPHLEELEISNCSQVRAFPENFHQLKHLKKLTLYATAIKDFPESMELMTAINQIAGSLDKDGKGIYGILPEAKEKLENWFPNAKIWIA